MSQWSSFGERIAAFTDVDVLCVAEDNWSILGLTDAPHGEWLHMQLPLEGECTLVTVREFVAHVTRYNPGLLRCPVRITVMDDLPLALPHVTYRLHSGIWFLNGELIDTVIGCYAPETPLVVVP